MASVPIRSWHLLQSVALCIGILQSSARSSAPDSCMSRYICARRPRSIAHRSCSGLVAWCTDYVAPCTLCEFILDKLDLFGDLVWHLALTTLQCPGACFDDVFPHLLLV